MSARQRARRAACVLAALALPVAAARAALGPRYGGTLRVGVRELPAPAVAIPRSADERLLAALTQATLLQPGADGQPLPELASGWSSAASGREWVVRLRPAAFHDGTPVTAADAVRSLRRFLDSGSPAAARLARGMAALEARGPATVLLRFDTPRPLALAPLAAAAAAITSGTGAGAGPFAPAATIPGRRASFVAAATHVRGRPFVDRVEVAALDESALGSDLQSGRLDLASGGKGGPLTGVLLLSIDPTRPPFDRPPVRQAVAAAIDRANLVRHLVPGGASDVLLLPPALLPPLAAGPWPPSATLPRAQAALAVSREVPFLVSQRVVAHLTDIGLQVSVEPRAPGRVLEAPAALKLWLWTPEVPEAGLALRELAGLGAPLPQVEEALAAAERELDLDRRRAHLHRAEAALQQSHVLVALAAVPAGLRAAPRLHGARVDAAGRILLEDAWWEP